VPEDVGIFYKTGKTDMDNRRQYPCPVCTEPREVRITRKKKPYLVCDPCGVQLFIRGAAGISQFDGLVERAGSQDLWSRIAEMERRYRLRCPKCGTRFWAEPQQAKTSMFDGSLKGFNCPKCAETVGWEKKA